MQLTSLAKHQFRSDLYYRLHVFPITVPSLLARREDIPLRVHYFVKKFAGRMGRRIEMIPEEAIVALEQYNWRATFANWKNLMERCVILRGRSDFTYSAG